MRLPALVKELDGVAKLVDDVSDLLQRVRVVVVFLLQQGRWDEVNLEGDTDQEVKDWQPEKLKDETHVAPVVEPTGHLGAEAEWENW